MNSSQMISRGRVISLGLLAVLLSPGPGLTSSYVQAHLGHLKSVGLFVRVSDLTRANLEGLRDSENVLRKKSTSLIEDAGLTIVDGRESPVLYSTIKIYPSASEAPGIFPVYISVALREGVMLQRDPSLVVAGGGITWWRSTVFLVDRGTLTTDLETETLKLVKEFLQERVAAKG